MKQQGIEREISAVRLGLNANGNNDAQPAVDVNAYRIKYDKDIERFFKQFTPKTQSGVLATLGLIGVTGVGLAIAGIVSPVFAIGGGVALATAGAGAIVANVIPNTMAYNKAKFKNRGIGGTEFSADAMRKIKEYSHILQTSKEKKFTIDGTIYSRKKLAKHIKELESNIGFIEIVKEAASTSHEAAVALAQNPNTKKIEFNGVMYSRAKLERIAEQNETVAYQGLKQLLDSGLEISDQIRGLESHPLTRDQQRQLNEYKNMIIRIGDCVAELATESNRTALGFERGADTQDRYNPYKKLIIDAIGKGCMLGDDRQNQQIAQIANQRKGKKINAELAIMQYSNMYEREALEQLDAEKTATLEANRQIQQKYQEQEQILAELPQKDNDIEQVKAGNARSRKSIDEQIGYQALIKSAKQVAANLPAEFTERKAALLVGIRQLNNAIVSGDVAQIEASHISLDERISEAYETIKTSHYAKGLKNARDSIGKAFVKYKETTDALIAQKDEQVIKEQKKSTRLTKTAWKHRAQRKELKKQNEQLEGEVAAGQDQIDRLGTQIGELDSQLGAALGVAKKLKHKNAQLTVDSIAKDNNIEELESNVEEVATYAFNATHELMMERQRTAALQQQVADRDSQLEQVQALQGQLQATQAELAKAQKENETLTLQASAAKRAGASKSRRIREAQTKVTKLQGKVAEANAELAGTQAQLQTTATELAQSQEQNKTLIAQVSAARIAGAAKSKIIKAKDTKIGELEQQVAARDAEIDTLSDSINGYVVAQGENIQQIVDLQAQNDQLSADNRRLTKTNAELKSEKQGLTEEQSRQAADMAYERHLQEKRIAQLIDEMAADRRYIDDLETTTATQATTIEQMQDQLDAEEAKKAEQKYYRDKGAAKRRRDNAIVKADAHLEHTLEDEPSLTAGNGTVGLLDHYIKTLLARDVSQQTIDEIRHDKELMQRVYEVAKSSLKPLSRQQLKDIVEAYKDEHGIKR